MKPLVLTAAAVLAGMPAAAAAATVDPQASPVAAPIIDGTRLEVVAEGEVRRVPDLATISAGVVTQAASATEALSGNAERMRRVIASLRAAGIAARDIRTDSVSLEPQYRYGENVPPVLTGYQARNSVSVRFREIARAGGILDALVKEGANQINGPTLSLAEPDAALDEARTDAIAKARARAELYARTLGQRVVRIASVSESGNTGGPRPVMFARARADAASTPIEPGEQEIGVTLTVVFELR